MEQSQITDKSLVLVLGAGASYEVNFPLGNQLTETISGFLQFQQKFSRFSGDQILEGALRTLQSGPIGESMESLFKAAHQIRIAMPQAMSIDNFIDAHRSSVAIQKVGKLAIVRSILSAEMASRVFVDSGNIYNRIRFENLRDTWFSLFFQLLTENCQVDSLPNRLSQVAVVSFNYDRSLEHYLYGALQNYYAIDGKKASSILKNLEIYHPYGTVGRLPWMWGNDDSIAYGEQPSSDKIVSLSERILTFTEGADASESDIVRIREILSQADRIAFLGFAFHRLNLELLFPRGIFSTAKLAKPIYATAVGISDSDVSVIKRELRTMTFRDPSAMHIDRSCTCYELFANYRRSLSLC